MGKTKSKVKKKKRKMLEARLVNGTTSKKKTINHADSKHVGSKGE